MNKCKICGKETNEGLLCIDCQQRLLNGEIKKCEKCDSFYIGDTCPCAKVNPSDNKPTVNVEDNEKIEVNIQQPKQESAFKKAVGTTFGTGCGCSLFIAIAVLLGLLLLLATCQGIMN